MNNEYYIVRGVTNTNPSVKRKLEVIKYKESSKPNDTHIITENVNGLWESDDSGFIRHGNSTLNKRIRIVKKFIEDKEPELTTYWIEVSGEIKSFSFK